MSDIDIETGLPKLPENFFWRVNRDSVEIRRKIPDTPWKERYYDGWGFTYKYSEPENGRRETRKVEGEVTRSRQTGFWWWKKTVYEKVPGTITQERYVDQSKNVVTVQTELNGDTTRKPGRYHSAEYRSNYGYYGYTGQSLVSPAYTEPDTIIEHRHPVTRENIAGLCDRALVDFNSIQFRGDYPPKSL